MSLRTRTAGSIRRTLPPVVTALLLGLGLLVGPASPAQAHHDSASALCGADYRWVAQAPIRTRAGSRIGLLHVTRVPGTKRWCAVMVRENHDARRYMAVDLMKWVDDHFVYARDNLWGYRYAGPVYMRSTENKIAGGARIGDRFVNFAWFPTSCEFAGGSFGSTVDYRGTC